MEMKRGTTLIADRERIDRLNETIIELEIEDLKVMLNEAYDVIEYLEELIVHKLKWRHK